MFSYDAGYADAQDGYPPCFTLDDVANGDEDARLYLRGYFTAKGWAR